MTVREVLNKFLDTDLSDLFIYLVLAGFVCALIVVMAYFLDFLNGWAERQKVQLLKKEAKNREKILQKMRSDFPELDSEELAKRVAQEMAREARKSTFLFIGLCILALIVILNADIWLP